MSKLTGRDLKEMGYAVPDHLLDRQVESVTVEANIIRANGTNESLGVIYEHLSYKARLKRFFRTLLMRIFRW